MNSLSHLPGFFGKVRGHGDFVSRRLSPEMHVQFDQWMQGGLVASKRELGDDWLPRWLNAPIWRFLLAKGICDNYAWMGVWMPSHDRIGRCFPLVMAASMDETPMLADCLTSCDAWFEQIEELALSTLNEDFSLNSFDAALIESGKVPCSSYASGSFEAAISSGDEAVVSMRSSKAFPMLMSGAMHGRTAWWTDGSLQVDPVLAVHRGFPSPMAFVSMLDGKWMPRGWNEV